MRIAISGRVDDDLDAFGGRGCWRAGDAILCAEVDCGIIGELTLFKRIEFRAIVGRKEDIVVREVETGGFDIAEESDGRERAIFGSEGWHGVAGFGAEQAGGERGRVGVDDDAGCSDAFARSEDDAARLATSNRDFGYGCVVAIVDAVTGTESLERTCEC